MSVREHELSVDSLGRVGTARRQAADGSVIPVGGSPAAPSNGFVAWLVLIGIAMPSSMTIFLAGIKFIPARIVICLLLIPAFFELFRRGRRLGATDFFVCAVSVWMLAAISQSADQSWSSTVALVLEFCGGYIVARAYFFGRPALQTFVRVFKVIVVAIVVLAAIDHLTQQIVTINTIGALWGLPNEHPEYRYGMLRAFSTFPHPILYGTFCVIAGAIFLYSERTFLYGGLCFLGCLMAMSSGPLMSFMIVIAIYCYDCAMQRYPWRWQALMASLAAFLVAVFVVANKPISWMIANLTLDPATGYFRVATWDNAFQYIGLSPLFGYGFAAYAAEDDFFGRASVDSVWLVLALRFGVPLVIFVILASITSFCWSGGGVSVRRNDTYMNNMRTGFTLVVVMFMFIGITVHYWNNVWIFWGICIGIRASLQEEYFRSQRSLVPDRRSKAHALRFGQAARRVSPQAAGHQVQRSDRYSP
jgi:hypothetical protein